ncbi:MAG: hypothetical protein KGD65_02325 [Candidatus Lokiarchaeota archaeon]|nr:hypothetical protein [Candidatus Lokiarchaeota archaeon]
MVNKIGERKSLLENSIRLLESILKNYGISRESKPVLLIQNRIRSYKRELQMRND